MYNVTVYFLRSFYIGNSLRIYKTDYPVNVILRVIHFDLTESRNGHRIADLGISVTLAQSAFLHSWLEMEPKEKKRKIDPGPLKGQKFLTTFFKADNQGLCKILRQLNFYLMKVVELIMS